MRSTSARDPAAARLGGLKNLAAQQPYLLTDGHARNLPLASRDGDPAFLEAKVVTARFYAEVILPPALAQLGPLKAAGRTVFALSEAQL